MSSTRIRKPLELTQTWAVVEENGIEHIERDNDGLAETLSFTPSDDGILVRVRDGPDDAWHTVPWEDLQRLQETIAWLRAWKEARDNRG